MYGYLLLINYITFSDFFTFIIPVLVSIPSFSFKSLAGTHQIPFAKNGCTSVDSIFPIIIFLKYALSHIFNLL
ncbi:MAG: hypothetical protein RSF37_07740, partial [Clostridium sp.]|uniref:hypothetical protein n=1 Tax=Clostridium sp. TaxID=1506 RepID=UPI002FCC0E97